MRAVRFVCLPFFVFGIVVVERFDSKCRNHTELTVNNHTVGKAYFGELDIFCTGDQILEEVIFYQPGAAFVCHTYVVAFDRTLSKVGIETAESIGQQRQRFLHGFVDERLELVFAKFVHGIVYGHCTIFSDLGESTDKAHYDFFGLL